MYSIRNKVLQITNYLKWLVFDDQPLFIFKMEMISLIYLNLPS